MDRDQLHAYALAAAIVGGTYAAVGAVLVAGPVAAALGIVAILAAVAFLPGDPKP